MKDMRERERQREREREMREMRPTSLSFRAATDLALLFERFFNSDLAACCHGMPQLLGAAWELTGE